MRKNIPLSIALFASCLMFVHLYAFTSRCAAETQALEIGCLDFPPYYLMNKETGEVEGIIIDFLKKMFDRIDTPYAIYMYPPARLYKNLARGKTNIWVGTTGVEAYADEVIVSPEKILDINLRVYTIGDNPLPEKKTDLNGMKLLTIQGYNYAGLITYLKDPGNSITIDESPSHEHALKKMVVGRGEYLLDYKEPVDKALANMPPVDGLKSSPLIVIPVYINISKRTPDAEGLMKTMMDTYYIMKKEGELPF